jgi:hypothetical protein
MAVSPRIALRRTDSFPQAYPLTWSSSNEGISKFKVWSGTMKAGKINRLHHVCVPSVGKSNFHVFYYAARP